MNYTEQPGNCKSIKRQLIKENVVIIFSGSHHDNYRQRAGTKCTQPHTISDLP